MPRDDGLSSSAQTNLKILDALLTVQSAKCHALAAEKISEWWSTSKNRFQDLLILRSETWLYQHCEISEIWKRGETGSFKRVLSLMQDESTAADPKDPKHIPGAPTPKAIRPSVRPHTPLKKMSDEEVAGFLEMLDEEGIEVVFDPGNSVLDNVVFRPPLIRLGDTPVTYDQVWPMYESGSINRTWDSEERTPEIALAFDLVLIAGAKEKKWTWAISDRYFSKLPWGHPFKTTPAGRPGWKVLNLMLEDAGLMTLHHGQTWRLTQNGRLIATEPLQTAWLNSL